MPMAKNAENPNPSHALNEIAFQSCVNNVGVPMMTSGIAQIDIVTAVNFKGEYSLNMGFERTV